MLSSSQLQEKEKRINDFIEEKLNINVAQKLTGRSYYLLDKYKSMNEELKEIIQLEKDLKLREMLTNNKKIELLNLERRLKEKNTMKVDLQNVLECYLIILKNNEELLNRRIDDLRIKDTHLRQKEFILNKILSMRKSNTNNSSIMNPSISELNQTVINLNNFNEDTINNTPSSNKIDLIKSKSGNFSVILNDEFTLNEADLKNKKNTIANDFEVIKNTQFTMRGAVDQKIKSNQLSTSMKINQTNILKLNENSLTVNVYGKENQIKKTQNPNLKKYDMTHAVDITLQSTTSEINQNKESNNPFRELNSAEGAQNNVGSSHNTAKFINISGFSSFGSKKDILQKEASMGNISNFSATDNTSKFSEKSVTDKSTSDKEKIPKKGMNTKDVPQGKETVKGNKDIAIEKKDSNANVTSKESTKESTKVIDKLNTSTQPKLLMTAPQNKEKSPSEKNEKVMNNSLSSFNNNETESSEQGAGNKPKSKLKTGTKVSGTLQQNKTTEEVQAPNKDKVTPVFKSQKVPSKDNNEIAQNKTINEEPQINNKEKTSNLKSSIVKTNNNVVSNDVKMKDAVDVNKETVLVQKETIIGSTKDKVILNKNEKTLETFSITTKVEQNISSSVFILQEDQPQSIETNISQTKGMNTADKSLSNSKEIGINSKNEIITVKHENTAQAPKRKSKPHQEKSITAEKESSSSHKSSLKSLPEIEDFQIEKNVPMIRLSKKDSVPDKIDENALYNPKKQAKHFSKHDAGVEIYKEVIYFENKSYIKQTNYEEILPTTTVKHIKQSCHQFIDKILHKKVVDEFISQVLFNNNNFRREKEKVNEEKEFRAKINQEIIIKNKKLVVNFVNEIYGKLFLKMEQEEERKRIEEVFELEAGLEAEEKMINLINKNHGTEPSLNSKIPLEKLVRTERRQGSTKTDFEKKEIKSSIFVRKSSKELKQVDTNLKHIMNNQDKDSPQSPQIIKLHNAGTNDKSEIQLIEMKETNTDLNIIVTSTGNEQKITFANNNSKEINQHLISSPGGLSTSKITESQTGTNTVFNDDFNLSDTDEEEDGNTFYIKI
jgi:hypothetical protein